MTSLEAMQRFYDTEFGPPGDFGSGFADALAVHKALKASFNQPDIADVFRFVLIKAADDESRIRFAAKVAELAQPKDGAAELPVYGSAVGAFSMLVTDRSPVAALQAIAKYPHEFASSPKVHALAHACVSRFTHHDPQSRPGQMAREALRQLGPLQG